MEFFLVIAFIGGMTLLIILQVFCFKQIESLWLAFKDQVEINKAQHSFNRAQIEVNKEVYEKTKGTL